MGRSKKERDKEPPDKEPKTLIAWTTDDNVSMPLFEKYKSLSTVVSELGYSDINLFRESKHALDFFPEIGLHAYEFAIGYIVAQQKTAALKIKATEVLTKNK